MFCPIKNSGLFFLIVISGMLNDVPGFSLFSDPTSFVGKGKSILTGTMLTLGFFTFFTVVLSKYLDTNLFIYSIVKK